MPRLYLLTTGVLTVCLIPAAVALLVAIALLLLLVLLPPPLIAPARAISRRAAILGLSPVRKE
jgi:hypothetical protein